MFERVISVRLRAEVADYIGKIKASGVATKDFVGELNKAAKAGQLDAVASMAGRAGLALSGGFLLAAGAAARFDQQMSHVNAVTNGTATELDRLRDAAIQAGKATQFSATEAGKAEEELAKAGIATADILGGGLAGALDLAAAGTIDLAEAADIAAKTMNVFNLEGKDVPHIADVLAASANKSATDVHEMGEALRMGGLAARNAGMSLEDTVGTLSAFADNALIGSDSGTSLKTMLQFLANPTAKAASLMQELGIKVYDAQGNFVGVEKVAGILQQRLGGLTQEQRQQALATIFGADATRAATVLYDLGEQGIRDYIEAVDDQGAAQDTARKKTDNLMGDLERLKGSLETLAIESGSGSTSGLRTLTQAADNLVSSIGSIPPVVQNTALIIAGVGGAALLTAAGMAKLKGASAGALEALAEMGPRGERAAAGLDKAGKMAARAGIAFAALQVGGAILSSFMGELNPQIDAAAGGLAEWTRQTKLSGEAARIFGDDTEKLSRSLSAMAVNGVSQFFDDVTDAMFGIVGMGSPLDDARERVAAFDATLAKMVRDGNARQAGEIAEEMARRANISVGEAMKVLPTFAGAVEEASRAGDKNAAATAKAAESTDKLAGSWQDAAGNAKGLITELEKLNGLALDWARAEIDLERAVDDAAESIKVNGKTLDVHTEKGRANREALLAIVEATAQATQTRYDETRSLTEAKRVYDLGRDALIRSAMATGATRAEAEKLAAQWLKMPPLNLQTPGLGAAIESIDALARRLHKLPSEVSINIGVSTGRRTAYRWGGVVEHAQSGMLRDAAVYRPREPALYAFAEPATGGEAFVPKHGDPARSARVLGTAASWYGMSMVPWRAMRHTAAVSRSESAPTPIVHVYIGDRRLEEMVDVRVEYAMDATARQVMSGVRA